MGQIYIKRAYGNHSQKNLLIEHNGLIIVANHYMNSNDLKLIIEQIKAQIESEEKNYTSAIIAKKDYNTLKTIRNKIADLKNKLKEINLIQSK